MKPDQRMMARILTVLRFKPKGMTITEIAHKINGNRNSVAKYLEILRVSGQVDIEHVGNARVFSLSRRIPIHSMLSCSSDFIAVIDGNRRLVDINGSYLAFFGLNGDAVLDPDAGLSGLPVFGDPEVRRLIDDGLAGKECTAETAITRGKASHRFRVKSIPTVFEKGDKGLTIIVEDITDQLLAQEIIRQNEEIFRSMAENLPFPIALLDEQGRYRYVNRMFSEVFGYTREEIPTGKEWFRRAFPDPSLRHRVITTWLSDLAGAGPGQVRQRIFPVVCAGGEIKEILFRPVTLPDNKQFIIFEDISESRRAERAQSLLASIVESSHDAIIGTALDGTVVSWNAGAFRLFGYTAEEMIGSPVTRLYPAGMRDHTEWLLAHIRRGEQVNYLETLRQCRDGRIITVSLTVSPIRDENRRIIGASSFVRDITEMKRAEEALEESRKTSRALLDASSDSVLLLDRDLRIVALNETALSQIRYATGNSGMTEEMLLGSSLSEHLPLSVRQNRIDHASRALRSGTTTVFNDTFQNRCYSILLVPIAGPDGDVARLAVYSRDVTDQQRSDDLLRSSHRRLADIIDFLPDPTFAVDADHRIIAWNHAIEALTGTAKEEMLGKGDHAYAIPFYGMRRDMLVDLITEDDAVIRSLYPELTRRGRILSAGVHCQRLYNGAGAELWVSASPLFDSRGDYTGGIETIRDITAQKRSLEQVLRQRDLGLALARAHTLDEALPDCLRIALQVTGMDCGGIELADEQGNLLLAAAENVTDSFRSRVRYLDGTSEEAKMVLGGVPLYYPESACYTDMMTGALAGEGIRVMASLPIVHEGRVIGCLHAGSHTAPGIPAATRIALETVAAVIGCGVVRMASEQRLREERDRYRALVNTAQDLLFVHAYTPGQGPGALLEVNDAACELLGVSRDELCSMPPGTTPPFLGINGSGGVLPSFSLTDGSIRFSAELTAKDGGIVGAEGASRLVRQGDAAFIISAVHAPGRGAGSQERASSGELAVVAETAACLAAQPPGDPAPLLAARFADLVPDACVLVATPAGAGGAMAVSAVGGAGSATARRTAEAGLYGIMLSSDALRGGPSLQEIPGGLTMLTGGRIDAEAAGALDAALGTGTWWRRPLMLDGRMTGAVIFGLASGVRISREPVEALAACSALALGLRSAVGGRALVPAHAGTVPARRVRELLQLNEQLMIALAGHASRESALQDERDSLFALLEAWGCCAVLTAPDGSICLATREAKNTLGLHNAPGGSWFDCIRDAEECTAARKAMRTVSCGDQQTASIPLRAGAGTEQRTWTLHPSPPGNGIPGHVVWMKGSD